MADERLNKEREYQESLRVTSSITSGIDSFMSSISDSQGELTEAAKKQVDEMKSIVSSVKTQEGIDKALVSLETQRLDLSKRFFGNNKNIAEQLKLTNDYSQKSIESLKYRIELTEKLGNAADDLANSFDQGYQSLVDQAKQIPVIGGALGWLGDASAEYVGSFSSSLSDGLKTSLKEGTFSFKSFASSAQGSLSKITAGLTGTMVAIGAFVVALGVAFTRFSALEEATKAFREETGLLISQTSELREQVRGVSVNYGTIGANAEMVSNAASAFTKEFDNIRQASESTISNMIVLNRNFGVSFETAAKTTEVFQRMAGLTEAQAQFMTASVTQMANLAGVAPEQVLSDIAENSEVAYRFFGGSVEELSKAAVEAAKLGTSLGTASEVAESLLDFESSISAELKASAMIGQDINLSRARYLAANGQILDSQQAVIDQVDKIGELTRLNTFQQDALVEATGMQFEELVKLQDIRQKFGELDREQLAAAKSYLDTQGDIADLSEEELDNLTERQSKMNEFRSSTERIGDALGGMGSALMDAFLPLADFVMPILVDIVDVLALWLVPLFKGIGNILGIIQPILSLIYNGLRYILGPIAAITGALIEGFLEPLSDIRESVTSLFEGFGSESWGEDAVNDIEPLIDVVKSLGYVLGWVSALTISMFVKIENTASTIKTVFSSIGSIISWVGEKTSLLWDKFGGILMVLNPIIGAFRLMYNIFTDFEGVVDSVKSTLSSMTFGLLGGEETSVEDAVINPKGDVVSTDPQDWLIATKTPTELSQTVATAGSTTVDMKPVLAKLEELKQAYMSNKDVYMDRQKVSSNVKSTNERSRENYFGLEVG